MVHPGLHWARPQWSSFLAWATIIWETSFPLALIAPPWAMAIWLIVGVTFHLGCAGLMERREFRRRPEAFNSAQPRPSEQGIY